MGYRVSPALTEPMARGFIAGLGGPVNRHGLIGRQRWWTPLRVLLLVSMSTLALAYLIKSPCTMGGTGGVNWGGGLQYYTTCYNDVIPLYRGRGLDHVWDPYAYSWTEGERVRYMEYPVLTGWFQAVMGILARTTYGVGLLFKLSPPAWYFVLTALVLSVVWALVIRMVVALTGRRVWDTVLVAASPLVVVHAFTNWDILSVAFAVGALLAFRDRRFVLTGVLLGLGLAAKLWPLFLFGAFLTLALREARARRPRWGETLAIVASAAGAWVVVNGPVMLAHPEAWGEFLRLNSTRGAEWSTVYAVLGRELGVRFSPDTLNTVSFGLFALACLAILVLGLRAPRTPRVAELGALIVVAFLLVNKVWSPQYSLWLVVPLVLALPRWRLLMSWMIAEALVWPAVMYYMVGQGGDRFGLSKQLLDLVLLVRGGLLVAIVVIIVRQILSLIHI